MTISSSVQHQQHVYRIDKFKVPPSAREEFFAGVHESQGFLSTLPGFVRNSVFEQMSGPGAFNFVTVVEWESGEAIEDAQKSVAAKYESIGFNPQERRTRLGIEADVAIYRAMPSKS
jgi:heme-degrading monooxygenase HmoA